MKTTSEMIEVMQASVRGEKIEAMLRGTGDIWRQCIGQPIWEWDASDYRIAPKPVRVPKMPDAPMFWVRSPGADTAYLIAFIDRIEERVGYWAGTRVAYSLEDVCAKGWLWSADRKTWHNFYGEEIKP